MKLLLSLFGFFAPFVAVSSSALAAGGLVATDPKDAGPDFLIQGEYASKEIGAQVIAQGDGKFHVILWHPGLPGTSPTAEKKMEFDATTTDGKVIFSDDKSQGQIVNGELTFKTATSGARKAKRVERESPTLGSKPPSGAVVLFNGENTTQWAGGRLSPENFLMVGTKTLQAFQNFTLHLEFRLPFKPFARGQDRGNSGVYLQNRYEVQVLDSFGLSGENNECGGVYEISKPKLNMCFPPLQWQTYDIDFTAAKYDTEGKKTSTAVVTVRHNGVLVQDHLEIPHVTRASGMQEGAEPGPIFIQDHGNPVVYRNIWITEKKN